MRLARALAGQEGLQWNGLPSLGPLARQRLAVLNLLRRATVAGIAYGYALYQRADPGFFQHVRFLVADELRIACLEERLVRDLEDAAARRTQRARCPTVGRIFPWKLGLAQPRRDPGAVPPVRRRHLARPAPMPEARGEVAYLCQLRPSERDRGGRVPS